MPKFDRENCERLAQEVVDHMDMADLLTFACDAIANSYFTDENLFQHEWPLFFDEE